ncbi:Serine-threonine-isoleucine rich protein [Entamoeba marina]
MFSLLSFLFLLLPYIVFAQQPCEIYAVSYDSSSCELTIDSCADNANELIIYPLNCTTVTLVIDQNLDAFTLDSDDGDLDITELYVSSDVAGTTRTISSLDLNYKTPFIEFSDIDVVEVSNPPTVDQPIFLTDTQPSISSAYYTICQSIYRVFSTNDESNHNCVCEITDSGYDRNDCSITPQYFDLTVSTSNYEIADAWNSVNCGIDTDLTVGLAVTNVFITDGDIRIIPSGSGSEKITITNSGSTNLRIDDINYVSSITCETNSYCYHSMSGGIDESSGNYNTINCGSTYICSYESLECTCTISGSSLTISNLNEVYCQDQDDLTDFNLVVSSSFSVDEDFVTNKLIYSSGITISGSNVFTATSVDFSLIDDSDQLTFTNSGVNTIGSLTVTSSSLPIIVEGASLDITSVSGLSSDCKDVVIYHNPSDTPTYPSGCSTIVNGDYTILRYCVSNTDTTIVCTITSTSSSGSPSYSPIYCPCVSTDCSYVYSNNDALYLDGVDLSSHSISITSTNEIDVYKTGTISELTSSVSLVFQESGSITFDSVDVTDISCSSKSLTISSGTISGSINCEATFNSGDVDIGTLRVGNYPIIISSGTISPDIIQVDQTYELITINDTGILSVSSISSTFATNVLIAKADTSTNFDNAGSYLACNNKFLFSETVENEAELCQSYLDNYCQIVDANLCSCEMSSGTCILDINTDSQVDLSSSDYSAVKCSSSSCSIIGPLSGGNNYYSDSSKTVTYTQVATGSTIEFILNNIDLDISESSSTDTHQLYGISSSFKTSDTLDVVIISGSQLTSFSAPDCAVIFENGVVISGSVEANSITIQGDFKCNSMTVDTLTLNSNAFLTINGDLTISTGVTSQFLNYDISGTFYSVMSYLTTGTSSTTKACYLIDSDISDPNSFSNPPSHGCHFTNSFTNLIIGDAVSSVTIPYDITISGTLSGPSSVVFSGSGIITINGESTLETPTFNVGGIYIEDAKSQTVTVSCGGSVYSASQLNVNNVQDTITTGSIGIFSITDYAKIESTTTSISSISFSFQDLSAFPSSPLIHVSSLTTDLVTSFSDSGEGLIFLESDNGITSTITNGILICNNKYVATDITPQCPSFSCTSTVTTSGYSSSDDCNDCTNMICTATININTIGSSDSIDLSGNDAQTVTINITPTTDFSITLSDNVEKLTINGNGNAIVLNRFVKSLEVSNAHITFSSASMVDNAYINGDSSTSITIVTASDTTYNFWSISCNSLTISGDSDIYIANVLEVSELSSTVSVNVYGYVDIGTVTNAPDLQKSLIVVQDLNEHFVISAVSITDQSQCYYIANFRYVTENPDSISLSDTRIYSINSCSEEDITCVARSLDIDSVDISESTLYTYPSLCPNTEKVIDLSPLSEDVTIFGFSGDYSSEVIVPNNARLQHTNTDSVTIANLNANSVTFDSSFIIDSYVINGDSTSLTINENVKINSISDPSFSTISIENEGYLTIDVQNMVVDTLSLSCSSECAVFSDISVTTLNVAIISGSTSSLVQASEFTFSDITSSNPLDDVTTLIVTSTTPFTSGSLTDGFSVVCNNITLVYDATGSIFTCPDVYSCSVSSSDVLTSCPRSSDNNYYQQYRYIFSTSNSDGYTVNENIGLVDTYDYIEMQVNDQSVTLVGGTTYYLTGTGTGTTYTCDTTSNPCYVIIDSDVTLGDNFEVIDSSIDSDSDCSGTITTIGTVTVTEIETSALKVIIESDSNVTLQKYSTIEEITIDGGNLIAEDSSNILNVIFNSGSIIVSYASAVLDIDNFDLSSYVISSSTCEVLIHLSGSNEIEKVFEASFTFDDSQYSILTCGGSQLVYCPSSSVSDYECPSIICDINDQRDICFCRYEEDNNQHCILNCDSTECTFNSNDNTEALFEYIDTNNSLITFDSSASIYALPLNQSLNFEISSDISIFKIIDGVNPGENIVFNGVSVNTESISMHSSSTISICTDEATARHIEMSSGTLSISSPVSFEDTTISNFDFSETFERGIEITGGTVEFSGEGSLILLGGSLDETEDFVNKVTMEDVTIVINRTSIANYLIEFNEVGIATLRNINVEFVGEGSEKCYVLLRNNVIEQITVESSSDLIIDDQKYVVYVCDGSAETGDIPELSCQLDTSYAGSNVSLTANTNWERETCPCTGNACIIDVSKTNTYTATLSNSIYKGYYLNNTVLSGSNVSIDSLIISGSQSTISLRDSSIETLTLQSEVGDVKFTAEVVIGDISSSSDSNTVTVSSVQVNTSTVENVDISIVRGGSFSVLSGGDLSGQTISLASNTYFDIYGENLIFSDTVLYIAPSAGQPSPFNIDDDVSSTSTTMKIKSNLEIHVEYNSSNSGVYQLVRLPVDFSYKLSDFTVALTDVESSSATSSKRASTFKLISMCQGIILTNLNEDDVVCPTDRLNLVNETTEFPMYMIAVIVIFVLVLCVILVVFISYFVHVMLTRRRNNKLFKEDAEEVVDEDAKTEETSEAKPEKEPVEQPPVEQPKTGGIEAPLNEEVPANEAKTESELTNTGASSPSSSKSQKSPELTIGVDFYQKTYLIDKTKVLIRIFDFTTRTDRLIWQIPTHAIKYFVVLYDVNDHYSFQMALTIIEHLKQSKGIVIVLVGNKTDLNKREVPFEEALNEAKKLNCFGVYETTMLNETRTDIVMELLYEGYEKQNFYKQKQVEKQKDSSTNWNCLIQ